MPVCERPRHAHGRSAHTEPCRAYRACRTLSSHADQGFISGFGAANSHGGFFLPVGRGSLVRSLASRMYFDELVKATGAPAHSSAQEEAALTDFRRKGFFLSYGVECPFESEGELHAALRRLAPTALKRVQYSLQPNYIVPIGAATKELIRLFGLIGWGDRLVLDKTGPFVDPYLGDAKKQATFGTAFGERISKLLAGLP